MVQVVIVGSRVEQTAGGEPVVRVRAAVPEVPRAGRALAGPQFAELAGRPVAALVHGAAVDALGGPAERGPRPARGMRERGRVVRPVTGPHHRVDGHAADVGRLQPAVDGRRPEHGPPLGPGPRRLRERRGRGGHGRHRARAALAAQIGDGPRGPRPLRVRQALGHVVVALRRHVLHRAAAAAHLVVAGHRLRRPLRARPPGEAGPVRRGARQRLLRARGRPQARLRLRHDGRVPVARNLADRLVRLSARHDKRSGNR